MSKYTNWLKK